MHGRKLDIQETFLTKLVPLVGEMMGDFYPNVVEQSEFVIKVIKQEEERFHETLTEGLDHLVSVFDVLTEKGEKVVAGKDAFTLYDTFGFPVELTEEYALEKGFEVDIDGFAEEMEKQRERARAARGNEQSMNIQSDLLVGLAVESEFTGYEASKTISKLNTIISEDEIHETIEGKRKAQLIFDATPFYAEKGGQSGDKGVIQDAEGKIVALVTDTKSAPAGQTLHIVETKSELTVGTEYNSLSVKFVVC